MLKVLQARLQQCMNCELPDVQARFRKGRGSRDQIANIKAVYCYPAYLTYMKKYIMRNARLDEAQAGIKIARRNIITGRSINNLKYADEITLMAKSEEELKSLLM